MEMTYKPGRIAHVPRPYEEELRRDVTCPNCGLEHAVFGLAIWCPDCGADIFLSHVAKEFEVIEMVIGAVEGRRDRLGARIAGRDIENALEDTVSIFEAVMKEITRRHLAAQGKTDEDIERVIDKVVRNRYQSVRSAAMLFEEQVGFPLFESVLDSDIETLKAAFEKRHPIAHNLGIVDRKYLERALSGELEGREIRLTEKEVLDAIRIARDTIARVHSKAFPDGQS